MLAPNEIEKTENPVKKNYIEQPGKWKKNMKRVGWQPKERLFIKEWWPTISVTSHRVQENNIDNSRWI